MGSLAGADPAAHFKRPGTRCTVAVLFDELDDDDIDAVRSWLADPTFTTSAIVRTLAEHGHKLAHSTMQRHRNRQCHCEQ